MPKRTANTNGGRDKPGNAGGRERDTPSRPSMRDEAWEVSDRLPPLSRDEQLPYPPLEPQRGVNQTSSWRGPVTPPQVLVAKPLGPDGLSPDLTRFTATLLYVPRFVRHLYRRLRSRMPFRPAWASARTRMRQYF